jgi:hypothetical protein
VFKVRKGLIDEVGIARRTLTGSTRARQRTFLTSFQ